MSPTDHREATSPMRGAATPTSFVTFEVARQLFGIPVTQIRDVLEPERINRIPLAPPEVAGALNLRGRIVTAIDLHHRLALESKSEKAAGKTVVVEQQTELYSLMVDEVGDVMDVDDASFEPNPPTLNARLAAFTSGVFKLESRLLIILDVDRLLKFDARRGE